MSVYHAQGDTTALIWAAIKGRVECVRLLLEAGADANAKAHVRVQFLRNF